MLFDKACLADEELKAEEDTIEETKRRAEEQSRRAQLEVQMREEEKRIREERMYVLFYRIDKTIVFGPFNIMSASRLI